MMSTARGNSGIISNGETYRISGDEFRRFLTGVIL